MTRARKYDKMTMYYVKEDSIVKKYSKLVSLALAALMVLSLAACNGNNATADSSAPEASTELTPDTTNNPDTSLPPADSTGAEDTTPAGPVYEDVVLNVVDVLDNVKVLGRSMICDDGLAVDWPASGIEFNAYCKGEIKITLTSTEPCKFAVYVDGTQVDDIKASAGTADYTVATDLAEGLHSVGLVKKSDNAVESTPDILTSISKIALCGQLDVRQEDKEFLIEFVGDSITCGLGTVAAGSMETDATATYAYRLAQLLGVDYSFVAVSGIGVLESTDQNNGLLMSDIYSYTNYYRDQTVKYEPTRKADLVIVALNTNDNGRVQNSDRNAYWEKSVALLSQIRAIHGEDVKILWVSALMFNTGTADSFISYSFRNRLGGEDAGYYYTTATPNSAGAFSHPSAEGHAANAEIIANYIREKNLLG